MIMAEPATRKVPARDEEAAVGAVPVVEPDDTVLVRRACEITKEKINKSEEIKK